MGIDSLAPPGHTTLTLHTELEASAIPFVYKSKEATEIVQDIAARCRYISDVASSYMEPRNQYGQTALHEACLSGKGSVALVLELLKTGKHDVNAVDLNGNTPLMTAAASGLLDIMIVLLEDNNTDVHHQANNNSNVLHSLCAVKPSNPQVRSLAVLRLFSRTYPWSATRSLEECAGQARRCYH